ncbi:Uncharacterized protein SCF082_LOCUS14867, partial [Durusdinium trenchii]
ADGDANDDEFQRRLHKRVLKHLRKQHQAQEEARRERKNKKKKRSKIKIIWDVNWKRVRKFGTKTIGFFVPPAVYLPVMFLLRLVFYWPLVLSMRVAQFTRAVFAKTWPMMLDLLRHGVRFPRTLALSTLQVSEAFAYATLRYLGRQRRRIQGFVRMLRDVGFLLRERTRQALDRSSRKGKRRFRKVLKRVAFYFVGLFDSTYTGVRRLIYLLVLPVRVAFHGLRSMAWAGRITFSSFTTIPERVGAFIVNSPFIFGRSGKRLVKFIKNNRKDIVDVIIALVFLTILSMMISGVFFPLVVRFTRALLGLLRNIQATLSRLRIPRLRIPRLNTQKLRQMLPSLPVSLPSVPLPDLRLLLGLRERTFLEKVARALT